jgi:hypothetical protein
MAGWGWLVLALVFVDEVLAAVAAGVAGHAAAGVLGAGLAPLAVVVLWWAFASPKAPLGGPVARPLVKVVVFGAACAGLWWAGHEDLAVALLVFSVVVNALAQLPAVRALVPS